MVTLNVEGSNFLNKEFNMNDFINLDQITEKKFNVESENWSRIRMKTVNDLHSEWKNRSNDEYIILKDTKLENDKLAMLKLKELQDLIEYNKLLTKEYKEQSLKISKYQNAIGVIQKFLKNTDFENKELIGQILGLI